MIRARLARVVVVRTALATLCLVGCYSVRTAESEPPEGSPAAGGGPTSGNAPDAGVADEACEPGTVLSCACPQGGAGRKRCVSDGTSPLAGRFTQCGDCRPVIGRLCEHETSAGTMSVDQSAADECARSVVNALSACVVAADGSPLCVLLECFPGFRDCNGDPADGCECAAPGS